MPDYKMVTLEEVLGKKFKKPIDNSIEFIFINSLKRELNIEGYDIDLKALEYEEVVFQDEYFSALTKKDSSVRSLTELKSLAPSNKVDPKLSIKPVNNIILEDLTGEHNQLLFIETDYTENLVVRGTGDSSTKYISVCARAFVHSFINGTTLKKFTINNMKEQGSSESHALLPILMFRGNAPLQNKLRVLPKGGSLEESMGNFMIVAVKALDIYLEVIQAPSEIQSVDKKYQYLKDTYRKGSVLGLYEYGSGSVNGLVTFSLVIVQDIKPDSIRLRRIRMFNTRVEHEILIEEQNNKQRNIKGDKAVIVDISDNTKTENLYFDENYTLYNLGIDKMFSRKKKRSKNNEETIRSENFYLCALTDSEEITTKLYTGTEGIQPEELVVSSIDFAYALLSDWGIDFDVLDYRNRYYEEGQYPLYDKFRDYNITAYNKGTSIH